MSKVFDLVPGVVWAAIVVLLGIFAVTQTFRLDAAKVDLAKGLVTIAEARASTAIRQSTIDTLTRDASESARAHEAAMTAKAKENTDELVKEQARSAAALVAARNDQRGLRAQLAKYAAGTGGASGTPEAAGAGLSAETRAAALGDVLGTCRGEALEDAGELEQLADQVRGLQRHSTLIENDYWGSAVSHR